MAFQKWQIGLDIQNGQFCSLAIQRRRGGWQLCHWFQHALPHDTIRNGMLQRSAYLYDLLLRWRKQLPRHINLRVGFPPQLILQRQIPLSSLSLREPELRRYVDVVAKREFPVPPEDLVMDYRVTGAGNKALHITAAHLDAVELWRELLTDTGCHPQIMELSSHALGALALEMKVPTNSVLVHQLADHWIWFNNQEHIPSSGWCPRNERSDIVSVYRHYFPDSPSVWFSSICPSDTTLPDNIHYLDPFKVLHYIHPPLPLNTGACVVAMGLALRPEDE